MNHRTLVLSFSLLSMAASYASEELITKEENDGFSRITSDKREAATRKKQNAEFAQMLLEPAPFAEGYDEFQAAKKAAALAALALSNQEIEFDKDAQIINLIDGRLEDSSLEIMDSSTVSMVMVYRVFDMEAAVYEPTLARPVSRYDKEEKPSVVGTQDSVQKISSLLASLIGDEGKLPLVTTQALAAPQQEKAEIIEPVKVIESKKYYPSNFSSTNTSKAPKLFENGIDPTLAEEVIEKKS